MFGHDRIAFPFTGSGTRLEGSPRAHVAQSIRPPRVLVANDSSLVRWALSRALASEGIEVRTAASREEMRQEIQRGPFELVVTPMRLHEEAVVDLVQDLGPNSPRTVMVWCDDHDIAVVRSLCASADIISDREPVAQLVWKATQRLRPLARAEERTDAE